MRLSSQVSLKHISFDTVLLALLAAHELFFFLSAPQTNELYQLAAVAFCLLSAWVRKTNADCCIPYSVASFIHTKLCTLFKTFVC